MKRLLFAVSVLVISTSPNLAHPDKVEDRLVLQFATGVHPPKDGYWEDLSHNFKATVKGSPILTNLGPALALANALPGKRRWSGEVPAQRRVLKGSVWCVAEGTVEKNH